MKETSGQNAGATSSGLAYSRIGTGVPVVLLHGWCLNRRLWMYLEESLSHSNTVFAPDLPGFGDSLSMPGPYDMDRMVRELDAFLTAVPSEPSVVIGFAFGAAVALSLAAQEPTNMRALVSIGVPSAAHAAYERMPRAMRRDWPLFADRSARAICKSPVSEPSLQWLSRMFASTPLPVALETVEVLAKFEPTAVAPDVKVPTLFVHGSDDDIVPPSVSQECASLIPGARVEIVPESGHLVLFDQKDRLAEIIRRFLSQFEPMQQEK